MKLLWLDCETSGLNSVANDILTLSCIVEIDGKVEKGINLSIQPFSYENIDYKALEINGLDVTTIKTFDEPKVAHKKLTDFLSQYVDRYNPEDKFYFAGYNVHFDVSFIEQFFKKCGDKYFGSWINKYKLDIFSLVHMLAYTKKIELDNYKLKTVCDYFKIPIMAHSVQEDIIATRNLFTKLTKKIEFKDNEKNL